MFTYENKDYDETKLNDKAKIAFNNLKQLSIKRNEFLLKIDHNNILINHYNNILKDNLSKENIKLEAKLMEKKNS